jgi:glycosyltransferase involved in cell wall biosynthesis
MITVLTPTYNRAHTLDRAYQSLVAQTAQDFEWLVVDDGSTDGTPALLRDLRARAPFPLRVVAQANGGKHVALNAGSDAAAGEWVLILDSDDALVPDALATIRGAIAARADPDVVGLCFRKAAFDGTIVGIAAPEADPVFLSPTHAGQLFRGDLAYVFRAVSLRAHPFPVIAGEIFFPELYVWNRIGDDGRILCFPSRAIYLCEYLPDGYSANFAHNLRRNPRGFLVYYRAQIRRERSTVRRLKCLVRALQCVGFIAAKKVRP